MVSLKVGKRLINQNSPTFIIAEAGSNHDGDLNQAFQLVDIAVKAKVDAVKFQIFKADKLYPKNCGNIKLDNKIIDIYGFLKKHEVDYSWIPKLKKYCDQKNIIFFATPFDEKSANILDDSGVLAYKIGSPELNHIPLINHIAKKSKPMILSDGLSTLSEIELAIESVKKQNNNQVAILHCLSSYPAPANEYNLNFIQTLIKVFGVVAGVSDHTTNPFLVPTLAVCNGARIVEKHFTLNKKLPGADHFFALEPDELTLMVKKIREVEKYSLRQKEQYMSKYKDIMGGYQKTIAPSEMELYPGDKRSIFVIGDIKSGQKLNKKNIRVLRAERFLKPGIHPSFYDLIINKTAKRNIKKFQGLQWSDVLN